MEDLRRQFALRLLGETGGSSYRREVPAEARTRQFHIHAAPKSKTCIRKAGRQNRQIRLLLLQRPAAKSLFLSMRQPATSSRWRAIPNPRSPGGCSAPRDWPSRDLVYNPGRLRHPLKRTGGRGEGNGKGSPGMRPWTGSQRNCSSTGNNDGPQGVAFLQGTIRGWSRVYSRLANAFGAVNHGAAGWAQCLWPRLVDNTVTFGATYTEVPDFENTRCMLVWGTNPASTWPYFASQIMDATGEGGGLDRRGSLSVRDGRQGRYLAPAEAGNRYGACPGDAPCHHPRRVV